MFAGAGPSKSRCMSGLIKEFHIVRVWYFRMIMEGRENHGKNAIGQSIVLF